MKKSFILSGAILGSLLTTSTAFANTHEVLSGENLTQISKKYNTSVSELKTLNNLENVNLLFPGQVLKVSEKEETYKVEAGDSLSQIAKNHKTSINQLIKLNPEISNPNLIVVGQTIRVSGVTNETNNTKQPTQVQNKDTHTVKLGDTLSKIAKSYNQTVDFLLALNPEITNKHKIKVGQTIKVAGTVVSVNQSSTATSKETGITAAQQTEPKASSPVAAATETSTPVEQPKVENTSSSNQVTESSSPTTINASVNNVISVGEKYLGARYLYGASTSRTDAFDCSSFTYRAFQEGAGITLPRTSSAQASVGTQVSLNALQKGDLVFFDTDFNGSINHVGIYVGGGQMINAATSKGVSYANITSGYWKERLVKATRVL